jgi:hypothetical protein
MSSADVRAAVTAFLESPALPGLSQWFKSPPWFVDGDAWNLADHLGSGSVGMVHLTEKSESRITYPAVQPLMPGAPIGQKAVRYKVGLVVLYQYLLPSSTLAPVPSDDYVGQLDATLDAIEDRLRSDPNLGNPDVIFQAGQDQNDITIHRDLPRRTSAKILAWTVVEFNVLEIINA